MLARFARPRTVWWPTWLGWLVILLVLTVPAGWWALRGEQFLGPTEPLPAEVLVVEGWIGLDGLDAARAEFARGGYRYLVTAGGPSGHRWDRRRWNFAESAAVALVNAGMPADRVIAAPATASPEQRTYESAVAVRTMLAARGLRPEAINVMTMAAHTRRSRLVFAKVFRGEARVGAVTWWPREYAGEPWWRSSERASDLLKETAGYAFERLLGSGRWLRAGGDNAGE
jgi:hypothetical protein